MLYIYIVGVCIVMSATLQGARPVKILDIRVPEVIQYGTKDSVILDCDFVVENTTGLVVKWFFMDKYRPIYQWIYKQKPQALGLLRGRVDLSYKASRVSHKMYRAMRILNPGTELTGDYTCVVSTFLDEDEKTKLMTIFERKFHFIQDKLRGDLLNVICSAEAMYPEPSITIRAFKRELNNVRTSIRKIDGLYSAVASSMLNARDLASPTEFVCEVQICQANYISMRKAIYFEGFFDTTTCEQPNGADLRISIGSSICCQKWNSMLLVLFHFVGVLFLQ